MFRGQTLYRPRNPIEYTMVYPAAGAFIGGWLGAIPIALDWDRPWQVRSYQSYPAYLHSFSPVGLAFDTALWESRRLHHWCTLGIYFQHNQVACRRAYPITATKNQE